ncbi:MAG: FIST C-terminal domain-containing protein [Candidatus Sungbacteria bacterium]|nr:FIST C-terminal domain-containing protein [Candidatus Sungbacteria bacterium]
MAIRAGVGLSSLRDARQAGHEACMLAMQRMGTGKPDFLFVFSSVTFNQQEVLEAVRDASGRTPLIGCTDAGEITAEGPTQKSVAVMAIQSDRITFTNGLGSGIKEGARAAGAAVAKDIAGRSKNPLRTLVILPDVLVGNGADIVRGALDVLGANFPLVGGAAGDDFLFEKTNQYRDDEIATGAIAGVGLSGSFTLGIGVRHGWLPIGIPMKVTKSHGAVVEELDHRPAISIYQDYFGEKAEDLKKEPLARMAITYPLGIKVPELDEYLIRDPITVDDRGAITCAAEIPEGSEIRLMIGSKERAVEAAEDAARNLMKEFERDKTTPKFLLMFNCIAREKLFAQKAKDEIIAVMNIIGNDVPLIGFYTYGEVAPIAGETRDQAKIKTRFYNETIVMCAIGE